MITIRCYECERPARWRVWYRDCSLPIGGGNIAYNSFCDEHVFEEMKHGRGGYPVECVKLVSDLYLPSGDRALAKRLKCPVCGHTVDDADYWAGTMCLRCALAQEQKQGGNQ